LNYNNKISVKCINRKNLIDPIDGTLLTKGKFYDLLEVEAMGSEYTDAPKTEENVGIYDHQSTTSYWIIDDTGKKRCYDGMRFDPNPLALKRLLLLSELGI
jgi:hypothetical protein